MLRSRIPLRHFHPRQFQPGFIPPSPSSLGRPIPARTYPKTRKYLRRLLYLSLATGTVYGLDSYFYASSITRTTRTFALGLLVALDYKLNFRPNPPLASSITAVHVRNAERLSDLLRRNGGLYLKIGQAIAMQSAILPPEFARMFGRMFDDAEQNEWRDARAVVREDFGRDVEEVFGVALAGGRNTGNGSGKGVMETQAKASASVAQVHWGRLADGREIAVKIQKREIARQLEWDLWAFKVVTWVYTRAFDIPFYSLVPYISERLSLETNFTNEANNSERLAELIANEPRLRGRVYIPKVHRELSSHRVLTTEWIEGVRLWDKESITRPWRGGWREGSPGCKGTPLDPPTSTNNRADNTRAGDKIKPSRTHWRGPRQTGGLGLSLKQVMTTMVDLFSAQMFLFGFVHCDPHPGNIFIRRTPSGNPEIVLIDHGLYITMDDTFRHEYARFWKSLLTFDNNTLNQIVRGWGVQNTDLFASATLMSPYRGGDKSTQTHLSGLSKSELSQRQYELHNSARSAIKQILSDEDKWPQQLIFIGRCLRIIQANNQFLGSVVNRVKITGVWASRALAETPLPPNLSLPSYLYQRLRNWGGYLVFRVALLASDVWFWVSWVRQLLGVGGGMEEDIEKQMVGMAREMGVELQEGTGVFEG